MIRILLSVLLGLPILAAFPASSDAGELSLEFFLGTTVTFDTRLTVRQDGEDEISFIGDYAADPFKTPPYYVIRAGWGNEARILELQFVHQKMILKNPQGGVDHFEITHGFNMLTLNLAWHTLPLDARLGVGIVLPHTESVIRGEGHHDDYRVQGPVLVAGLGERIPLTDHLFITGDAQFIVGWATVKVARGEASASTVGFHFMLGLGVGF